MRLGILGGTFDPVHVGHLILAEEALSRLALNQLLFIPAGQPWLKAGQGLSPAEHRLKMVELAIASNPKLGVSRIEVDRSGPTYTVDTLEQLKQDLGEDVQLFFILGLDALEQFHRWEQPERIIELCQLAISSRPGFQNSRILDEQLGRYPALGSKLNFMSAPLVDISGSSIRRRASEGRSIKYRVPEAVERYIKQQGLYCAPNYSDSSPGQAGSAPVSPTPVSPTPVSPTVEKLLSLSLARGALEYGNFTLSSGKASSYYFDGRLLSLDPEGARLIGQALLPLIRQAGAQAVGGPTLAADPIVTAVSLASQEEGDGIPAFIVRKETKEHGMGRLIEGPLVAGSRVAIVDDTCTTGGSLLHAIAAAESLGCSVVKVIVLLDRREGGGDELLRRGYDFTALMAATPEGKIEVVA